MSNFVFILRNLVGSGMTNTESALIVLESFFQSEGNELRNNAISCRSEIADLKKDLTENTKSEEQTEIAFTKIKLRVLFLIDEVEKTSFDDEWAINYFAMLDPNPAYDPFFSPLKKPEKMPEDIIIPEEALIELPLESTKSKTNWSKRLLPIGGVLIGGLLLSEVVGYSPFSHQDDNEGFSKNLQQTNNPAPPQTINNNQKNYNIIPDQRLIDRKRQADSIAQERAKKDNEKPKPFINPSPIPIVKLNTEPIKPKPIINPKSASIVKPNTEPIKPKPVINAKSTPVIKPNTKSIKPKSEIPEIKPLGAGDRQLIIKYQDSLNIVMSNISKIEADTLQLYNQILQLNQIQKKDAKTINSLKNKEKQLKNFKRELGSLNNKYAEFWNIINGYK